MYDNAGEASPSFAMHVMDRNDKAGEASRGKVWRGESRRGREMHRRHPKPRQGGQGMTPNGNNREG